MSAVRRVAAIATDLTCQAVGRRTVVRTARYVLSRARLDYPNDLSANGESALQRWILRMLAAGRADSRGGRGRQRRPVVGINAGRRVGRQAVRRISGCTPSSQTRGLSPGSRRRLTARPPASAGRHSATRQGTSPFYVVAPAAGTNSLYPVPGANPAGARKTWSRSRWIHTPEQSGIARFALVKIDAEGHDLAVLRGARALLAEHRIAVAQFEYNHRWILARFFLRDAFEFLLALGYQVGKLTPRGVEVYPGWDVDLETFVEGNYLACDPEAAAELPTVKW